MTHEPASSSSALHRRAARTILVVDGDRARLGALAQWLGGLGYLVVLADSGTQALELISARGFDLVVLESRVPGGCLHLLHEIRGARDTADLPVIVLGEDDDPQEILGAFGAGADDRVAHPYVFEVLAARIARVLARGARLEELKRSNLALDARIAARAVELGEARAELAASRADCARMAASLKSLQDEIGRA